MVSNILFRCTLSISPQAIAMLLIAGHEIQHEMFFWPALHGTWQLHTVHRSEGLKQGWEARALQPLSHRMI
jgi:hypothetical protein